MDLIYQLILTFVIGIIASFIGAVTGGGGLISIPFLMFLGLPPQMAIATNKCGSVGVSLSASYKFFKAKKINWKYVLPFSVIAIIGGLIGAKILVEINTDLLSTVVGIILLAILPLIFIKREIGVKKRKTTKVQKTIGFILYFFLMIFSGFFGGGGGILIFYTLMFFMGFTIIESNATDIIPWFILSVSSLIFFMINGLVNYQIGIVFFFGTLIGGYVGAHTAIKKGDAWVKLIFAVVVLISGMKILFF